MVLKLLNGFRLKILRILLVILGKNFNIVSFETLNLDETWNRGCQLHLVSNLTQGYEVEVHTRNLLVRIRRFRFKLKMSLT
jgi:hypothetical protein